MCDTQGCDRDWFDVVYQRERLCVDCYINRREAISKSVVV